MEVQEICRKLKPIIGDKAERYWLTYLAEDHEGKKDIEIALQLMAVKHLGSGIGDSNTNLSVPPSDVAAGEYPLGQITYAGKQYHEFSLQEDEWIQHVAIFGRSGAGKTNTVFVLIDNLLSKNKPFLIFDWKRNYRDLLAVKNDNILVYTVGRKTSPFMFNPLIPPTGTDPEIWLKKLIEIIANSYYLGEGVMFLLQEAINSVYKEFKVYEGKPEKYPTFIDVLRWLEDHPVKGRKALWMDSTMRGIKSICFGSMGKVVNASRQPNLAKLLEHNVILELDALTNNDKNMIIESMLLWIHHFRLTQPQRETFKHAIIIEEAHHILLKKAGTGGESITDTILREIRELGEAIVLIDQHPSLISIPALGNSYTTITMNLKHKSDVNAVAAAMLMENEEKDLLGRLPIGTAVVKLQGRWLQPFQVDIPHMKIPKGSINDSRLQELMAGRNILKVEDVEMQQYSIPEAIEIDDKLKSLIYDISEHPYSGVVERYKRQSVSRRKGDKYKNQLIEKEMIKPVNIPTKSGRIVLLEITDKGWQYLQDLGVQKPKKRYNESLEHMYWKHKVAEYYRKHGYNVLIEEPVNGYTDIVIIKDGKRIAVEIETGKSDWRKNVEKNLKKGFSQIMIAVTNQELLLKIENEITGKEPVIIVVRNVQNFSNT